MSDPCPVSIPTSSTNTIGRIGRFFHLDSLKTLAGFIRDLSRQDMPEDPKRLAVIISSVALAGGFLILITTISRMALLAKPLDGGLLTFTAGVGMTLGGLAGYVHRKPDDPLEPKP